MENLGERHEPMDLQDVFNQVEMYDILIDNSNDLYQNECLLERGPSRRVDNLPSRVSRLERNRIAQKKFRERQKVKLEEMNEELTIQKNIVSKLSLENAVLTKSIAFLRKEHQESSTVSTGSDLNQSRQVVRSCPEHISNLGEKDNTSNELQEPMCNTWFLMKTCWSRFVDNIRGLLAKYEGSTCDKAKHLENLKNELDRGIQIYVKDVLSKRQLLQHCRGTTYGDIDESMTGSNVKWFSVVQDMHLQKHQMDQIVSLRDTFIPRIEAKTLAQEAKLGDFVCMMSKLQNVPSFHISAEDLDSLNDTSLQVKKSMQEKQECVFEFMGSFFQLDLEPVQMATCIVKAHPEFPDVCRIAQIVSEIRL